MPRFGLVPFTKQDVKGGIFRFRHQLPGDVIEKLMAAGATDLKRTVTFSLKTRDPMAARSRALRAAADVSDMIVAVRAGATSPRRLDPAMYQRDGIVVPNVGSRKQIPSIGAGAGAAKPKMNAIL